MSCQLRCAPSPPPSTHTHTNCSEFFLNFRVTFTGLDFDMRHIGSPTFWSSLRRILGYLFASLRRKVDRVRDSVTERPTWSSIFLATPVEPLWPVNTVKKRYKEYGSILTHIYHRNKGIVEAPNALHTHLFVPFHTGYRKYLFTPKCVPMVKRTKWRLLRDRGKFVWNLLFNCSLV